jgi:N-sulfoglucosamine sulfohydrolase
MEHISHEPQTARGIPMACLSFNRAALACGVLLSILSPLSAQEESQNSKRPNILWIVSEDNSVYLGCYGHPDAKTPRLDQLASEGILYENAFANVPVCAPNRSTLITGMYASSIGTEHMRSRNFVPPQEIPFYSKYLKDARYYCTNNSKTDYNLDPYQQAAWNEMTRGDHHNRKPGQPFFAIYNIQTSHESSLHKPLDQSLLKAQVTIPPYHPDTPEIRANWAMYHQIITRMDSQVGEILDQLEKDGLADDTIVFYYSDHGGILTRSKRFLYDSGVHIPLIVRFGKNFAHLAPQKPGSRTDRLVSFVDLPPTLLSLAGIGVPKPMQGKAFLGEQDSEPRDYVYHLRGRMDERYDFSRGVRDKQFKYIRNYNPHRIYGQHLQYLWKMATTISWEAAYKAGKCEGPQKFFWEPKPPEELYDTKADPWEVKNLANDPKYADVLDRMRKANREHLLSIRDSGFFPEGEMVRQAEGSSIYELVRDEKKYPLERIMDIAELATVGDAKNLPQLTELLQDDHSVIRYWAATGLVILGKEALEKEFNTSRDVRPQPPARRNLLLKLRKRLSDESPDVQVAAAEALANLGETEKAVEHLAGLLDHDNQWVALRAANVLELIGEPARAALPALERAAKQTKHDYVQRAAEHTVELLKGN